MMKEPTLDTITEILDRLDRRGRRFERNAEVIGEYSWRVVISRGGFSLVVFGASNEGMITADTFPSSIAGTLDEVYSRACTPAFIDFAASQGDPIAQNLKKTLKRRHDPVDPVYLRLVLGEIVDLVLDHFDAYVAVQNQAQTPSTRNP